MLTELHCKRAKPADKNQKLADGRGLYLFVTPTGFKSWRWKYRIGGKEKRLVFGAYPEMPLAEARDARDKAARLLRDGIDPGLDRKRLQAAQAAERERTFEMVAREWHTLQARAWSPVHALDVMQSLEDAVFPRLGSLPVTAITSPMVLAIVRALEARPAIETARRVRQRISSIYSFAIASGYAAADPAQAIRGAMAPLIKGRQPAFTTLKDAHALLVDSEATPAHPSTKLASRFLALTAVRSSVLRLATWSGIVDLEGPEPLWDIPAARMKLTADRKLGDRFDFLVPLSRQAVEVLRASAELFGTHKLIFPGQRHAHRPLSENAIGYFYNRLPEYRGRHVPHGWRSTFSTVMNERAQELERPGDRAIIDLMLAHVSGSIESIYNRAAYMPRRRAIAQEWADLLLDGLPGAASLIVGPRR